MEKELLEKEHYGQNDDHIIQIHSTPVSESGESNMWVTEEFSILDPSCLSEKEQEEQDSQEKSNEAPFPWMSVAFFLSLYVYYYRWDTLFH
jgi:hypothetical protein